MNNIMGNTRIYPRRDKVYEKELKLFEEFKDILQLNDINKTI